MITNINVSTMKRTLLFKNPARDLGNVSFYQFVFSQASRINEIDASVLTDADLRQILAILLTLSEEFNKVILQVQKSIKTEEILAAKQVRDRCFSALKVGIKNAQYSTDAEVLQAAAGLTILINTCGNIARMALEKGSGTAEKLVEELEGPAYKPMIDKLTLSPVVIRLKKENESLVYLYESRRDDYLGKNSVKSVDLRKDVIRQYQLLCSYIVLKVQLSKDAQYHEALQIINTIRKEFAEMVARHKAARKNGKKKVQDQSAPEES